MIDSFFYCINSVLLRCQLSVFSFSSIFRKRENILFIIINWNHFRAMNFVLKAKMNYNQFALTFSKFLHTALDNNHVPLEDILKLFECWWNQHFWPPLSCFWQHLWNYIFNKILRKFSTCLKDMFNFNLYLLSVKLFEIFIVGPTISRNEEEKTNTNQPSSLKHKNAYTFRTAAVSELGVPTFPVCWWFNREKIVWEHVKYSI